MAYKTPPLILIRGAGDLASGVALRLFRSGFGVVMTEITQPFSVRRLASFSEAIFDGSAVVEGVQAVRCAAVQEIQDVIDSGGIAILVDPDAACRDELSFTAVVDGRMLKSAVNNSLFTSLFSIGLGPGYTAGKNCHAAVETNRGPDMGRVYWHGSTQVDTTEPEVVRGFQSERVMRASSEGLLITKVDIGDIVEKGTSIAEIDGISIDAPFKAVVRGLLRTATHVHPGMKIGDLDPRCDRQLCFKASDKALAVGGGVLEALLSRPEIRSALGQPV